MTTVNIHEAKTHLSKLLESVAAGAEVTIAKSGKPVAKLVRLDAPKPPRTLGILSGQLKVPGNFDAPLPAKVIASFAGG